MVIRYVVAVFIGLAHFAASGIEVRKAFHHKAGIGEQKGKSIELGSIVLYLDQSPQITSSISTQGGVTKQTFFLPAVTTISKEAQAAIASINQSKDLPYSASVSLKSKPAPGMEIVLTYNSKLVGVSEPRNFDAISMHKAIAIELYDRKLVKRFGKESRPIIEVAHNSRPQIIIDCGHGGSDSGAIGCNKLAEKEVTLSIGKQVADLLRANNIAVVLTRDSDATVNLDERTVCANSHTGNLFVSIHANSAANNQVCGVETYCIANNLFKKDSTLTSDADDFLFSKQLCAKYAQSNTLAHTVHTSLLEALAPDYKVCDRSVRHSVAQVLLGTTMPSILVEVGYLSHEKEAALLADKSYQATIAQGIVKGLNAFLATNSIA